MLVITKSNIQWGPFFAPIFLMRQKKRHSRIPEEKMTKISNYVCFIWVIFIQREEYFIGNQ